MSPEANVQAVWAQPPPLKLMEGREKAPKARDATELPGGGKLGWFWQDCKSRNRCGRPPYVRLLTSPVLRADYHNVIHRSGTRQQNPNLNE